MRPTFSVIIPAYNEEKFILHAVKSAINQRFPKDAYEIIIVDNNSTDKTASLIKDNFPSVRIVAEKKQGLVPARIRGIKEAKGEIVAFLDADAKATLHWLKDMYKIYQENENVVGVSQMINLKPKNWIVDTAQPIIGIGNKYLKIMAGSHFSFRKTAYRQSGGYSPKTKFFAEDVYISRKLKKVGQIVIQKRGSASASSRRLMTLETFAPYAWKYLGAMIAVYIKEFF